MKLKTSYLSAAVIAAVVIAFPAFLGAYPLNVARSVMTYMALAISWDMLLRSGQISFGIAGLFGLGSYASAIAVMRGGMDPFLSILFAAAFAGVMAFALGFAILRLRAMYFSITTLALMEIFRIVMHNLHDFSGGPEGIVLSAPIFGGNSTALYWLCLAGLFITIGVSWYFEKSKMHLALTAIRNDETSARSNGVDIFRYLLVAFVITSIIQGMMGAIQIQSYGFTTPETAFDANFTLLPLAMALLGGIHSTIGPMAGAVLLGVASEWLKLKIPYGHLMVYGIIIILVILFMPQGLVGLARRMLRGSDKSGRKAGASHE
ncbi:MAG: branched-chain amino acid ABC transporter permease [Spirochaetae bacterium HGW-Spirochaetae-7]|jgi:branched-chain amino acid transport system permease protein|nr:MAG: branched-chain amino acid ABC transporter permease [Spirochaetae bacterium HGW-Spirochaetae-7]